MSNYIVLDEQPTYAYLEPFFKYIQAYFPVTSLCKYYEEGEKRFKGTWDILDTIDNEIGIVNSYIDEYRKRALSHTIMYTLSQTNLKPNDLKRAAEALETLRDEVVDSDDIFYTWVTPDYYQWAGADINKVIDSFRYAAKPIKKIKMKKLYRPKYEPHAGTWAAVEIEEDGPKCGALIDDNVVYNCITIYKREKRAAPFALDGYAIYGYENIAAETPKDALTSLNLKSTLWTTCKDCGKLFYYYEHTLKGKNAVPKWCYSCYNKSHKASS